MPRLTEPRRRATTPEALARVLELHGECQHRCGLCHECGQQHPCRTTRAAAAEGTELPAARPAQPTALAQALADTPHPEPHPLAGQQIRVDVGHGPVELHCEDWWDRAAGQSWMVAQGNPVALNYAIRVANRGLPLDNNVIYGRIRGYGHLVHTTEILEED